LLKWAQLELPTNTTVEFHVTSLDVIHSFWAYQLGVKADANPGEDNIAYVTTKGPLKFQVHCAELCGVWHGYMYNHGAVVPQSQFASWIQQERQALAPATKALPPYAGQYFPAPTRRGG
jgi:cytochrome c oxidase subunit 2